MESNLFCRWTGNMLRLAVTLLMIANLSGCSYLSAMTEHIPFMGKKKPKETVVKKLWESGEQYVAIEKQDKPQGMTVKPNQRVSEISVERVRAMLSSMEDRQSGSDKSISLFNEDEIKILSEYIPVGLALAGPDEDVTFAVIGHYVEAMGFLKKREVTTGRVFCQNGQLNIIFGDVHRELKETMGKPEDRRLNPFLPGSRAGQVGTMDGSILPKPGGEIFNKIRQDWVAFQLNPGEGRFDASAATEPQEEPSSMRSNTGTMSPAPQELASGPAKNPPPQEPVPPPSRYGTSQEPAPPQYTNQPAPSYTPPAATRYQPAPQYTPQYSAGNRGQSTTGYVANQPKKSIEDRLTILNNLRNRRLITEQEYREKRMEILNEL